MKTSWISGSLAMAAKQCEMMGWPATSKSGYVSSITSVVSRSTGIHSIPWASPEKEDGSGFLVMVHRPARFSRVFFLQQTNVPDLSYSYQNDGLCDWGSTSCAANGHLQTHDCLVVKLSRAGSMFVAVYVDLLERCRSQRGVSVLGSVQSGRSQSRRHIHL